MSGSRGIPFHYGVGAVGPPEPGRLSVAALGDLMLAGEWDCRVRRGEASAALEDLRRLCGRSLLFGNLEVTLGGRTGVIAKQPRIIAERDTVTACLQTLRPEVVNLANNHTFDALWDGFEEVRRILTAQGVCYFGAGRDVSEARSPLILSRNGMRLGWLAYADAATRPSHMAGPDSFGVNAFDEDTAAEEIRRLAPKVNHVLVSLHWGIEYSHLPSPRQVETARRLIDSGARLVLGHHAHVLQGIEAYRGGVIAYNLGNAVATDLLIDGRLAIRQTRRSCSSVVLRVVLSEGRIERVELIPFRIRAGELLTDDSYADRLLRRANRRLVKGISPLRWRIFRLYEDVILRTLEKLHPRVAGSIRGRHVKNFFKNVASALRGREPA